MIYILKMINENIDCLHYEKQNRYFAVMKLHN